MKKQLLIPVGLFIIFSSSCAKQAEIGPSIGPDGIKVNAIRGPYIDPNGSTISITKDTSNNSAGNTLGPGPDPNGLKPVLVK